MSEHIKVIPTGLELDTFRIEKKADEIHALKQELGIGRGQPIILSVGRIAEEKNMGAIVSAMPEILRRLSSVKLVMVGDGPAKEGLEKQVKKLGISSAVIFTGAVEWKFINRYYQLGDVFVSASTTEAQGLTYVEAMAAGLPVVARTIQALKM